MQPTLSSSFDRVLSDFYNEILEVLWNFYAQIKNFLSEKSTYTGDHIPSV